MNFAEKHWHELQDNALGVVALEMSQILDGDCLHAFIMKFKVFYSTLTLGSCIIFTCMDGHELLSYYREDDICLNP